MSKFAKVKRTILKLYVRVLFGKITPVVKETVNGVPAEITYYNKYGVEVGYWAYGQFDPNKPYRGIG